MRILVDTNVYLDLMLQRDRGYESSLNFFIWCKKNKNLNYVSSMSLRDIEYVANKVLHDKEKTRKILADVYSTCTKVIGISADCATNAIYEDYKDFEDELLIQAAKENLLDCIVTNNKKHFLDRGIPAFSPEEIVLLS